MQNFNIKNAFYAALVIVITAGCAQIGPKAKRGALIGAGTGAVVSAVTDSNLVTGAVIGAAVGGGLGHLQD